MELDLEHLEQRQFWRLAVGIEMISSAAGRRGITHTHSVIAVLAVASLAGEGVKVGLRAAGEDVAGENFVDGRNEV